MSEKKMNILRAAACAFVGACCFALKPMGIVTSDTAFPYVGGAVAAFACLAYLKQAFDR